MARLEALVEEIQCDEGPESELLPDLYERLDGLDASTFETRASTILINWASGLLVPRRLMEGLPLIRRRKT